jgi:hypothetical protein
LTFLVGAEKGIDVRLALDVIRLAHQNEYDVALLFCSDQDLSEVAEEIRLIARERRRWIKIASAYPSSPAYRLRGINKTDWIPIDRATYDACLARLSSQASAGSRKQLTFRIIAWNRAGSIGRSVPCWRGCHTTRPGLR